MCGESGADQRYFIWQSLIPINSCGANEKGGALLRRHFSGDR
jgi:hypothetical protein